MTPGKKISRNPTINNAMKTLHSVLFTRVTSCIYFAGAFPFGGDVLRSKLNLRFCLWHNATVHSRETLKRKHENSYQSLTL